MATFRVSGVFESGHTFRIRQSADDAREAMDSVHDKLESLPSDRPVIDDEGNATDEVVELGNVVTIVCKRIDESESGVAISNKPAPKRKGKKRTTATGDTTDVEAGERSAATTKRGKGKR